MGIFKGTKQERLCSIGCSNCKIFEFHLKRGLWNGKNIKPNKPMGPLRITAWPLKGSISNIACHLKFVLKYNFSQKQLKVSFQFEDKLV